MLESSYRTIEPLESGGERARQGFTFQDHVAAAYCIDMLTDPNILEVWCEILDDITLVRERDEVEEFEFIQVKSNQLNQLWSVAKLCEQEQGKPGTSILEKSFANEQLAEPCRFRIVTCCNVNKDLKSLTFPLNSSTRTSNNEDLSHLYNQIPEKIKGYKSPIGNDISSWLLRTEWEVQPSEGTLAERNLSKLRAFGQSIGILLFDEQWNEIYEKLLTKVKKAGETNCKINRAAKEIKRKDFQDWILPLIKIVDIPENIPKRAVLPEKFVGREQEIKMLHQQIQEHGQVTVCAVMGMGGVGKTELALQYALTHKQNYPSGICWLQANEGTLDAQIVEFGKSRLQLEISKDLEDKVGYCWANWRPGDVLILLDNVDDFSQIKPYLPPQNSRFRVLITTRLKLDHLPYPLPLDVLTENASLELLHQWINATNLACEKEIAVELCRRLGCLPLALNLVGCYVKKRRISLAEMLRRLESKGLNHPSLQVDENDRTRTQNIERGVAAAFELSWEMLSESAKELGKALSICSSAHKVWLLLSHVTSESEIEVLEDARVELENLHLVQGAEQYQMHPLIQEFFQGKIFSIEEEFLLLKKKVDKLVCESRKIQKLLASVHERFNSVESLLAIPNSQNYTESEIIDWLPTFRTLFFCYMVRYVHNIYLALYIERNYKKLDFQAALECYQLYEFCTHGYELAAVLEPSLGDVGIKDLDSTVSFPIAAKLETIIDPVKEPNRYLDLKLLKTTENLNKPWFVKEMKAQISWWKTNEDSLNRKFKEFFLEYGNTLQQQAFDESDRIILRKYYDANKLLINCMNDCKVELRERIEKELLLPISEIEKEGKK